MTHGGHVTKSRQVKIMHYILIEEEFEYCLVIKEKNITTILDYKIYTRNFVKVDVCLNFRNIAIILPITTTLMSNTGSQTPLMIIGRWSWCQGVEGRPS